MSPKETKMNKTILRVFLAAAVVLLFCGAAVVAAGAAASFPTGGTSPDNSTEISGAYFGGNISGYYKLTGKVTLYREGGSVNAPGLIVPNGITCTIDLNGSELYAQRDFSVITVKSGGNLTLVDSGTGGKITGGKATMGGGVYVAGGTFIMNGGSIYNNQAIDSGGSGVYVASGGTFTMSGGSITGNSATNPGCNGGGVYVASGGTFTMSGSTSITGNSAAASDSGDGGGVYVADGGTFTMSGSASITGNTAGATSSGGGVYVAKNGTFNVCGAPTITDNKKGSSGAGTINNVWLANGKLITVTGPLTSGADIQINNKESGEDSKVDIAQGVDADTSKGQEKYTVTNTDGKYFHPDSNQAQVAKVLSAEAEGAESKLQGWHEIQETVVTFNTGDSPIVKRYPKAEVFTLPDVPQKENDTFLGWIDGSGKFFCAYYNEAYQYLNPSEYYDTDKKWNYSGAALTLTAVWAGTRPGPAAYTVTATAGTGGSVSVSPTGPAAPGTSVTLTATPASGYHFKQWVTAGLSSPVSTGTSLTFTMPSNDVSAVAEFEADTPAPEVKYSVLTASEDTDKGTVTGAPTSPIASYTEVTLNAVPNNGYSFKKWVTIGFAPGNPADTELKITMPAQDIAAVALFEEETPQTSETVIFLDANGGVNGTNNVTAAKETTLSDITTPTKTGHTLNGFFTAKTDGVQLINTTGHWIANVESFTDAGGNWTSDEKTLILYARWTENQSPADYSITITTDGKGSAAASADSAKTGDTVSLAQAAGDGYQFKEWIESTAELTIENNRFTMPAADVSIKAVFELIDKDIPIDSGTASVNSGTFPFSDGEGISVTVVSATNLDGDKKAHFTANNDSVPQVTLTEGYKDLKIYSVFTITAAVQDGKTSELTIELPLKDSSIKDYLCLKSYTENTWTRISPTAVSKLSDGDTTYQYIFPVTAYNGAFAIVSEIPNPAATYTITNTTVNGTVTANKTQAAEGEIISLVHKAETGYHFANWNVTNSTGGDISVDASNNFVMPAENVNAGAVFEINRYAVNFSMMGHGTQVENKSVTHGEKVIKPEDPSADGFTFNGWYKEAACSNVWYFETDTVTQETTLYAKWTANQYTVTFNGNKPAGASGDVSDLPAALTGVPSGSTITEPSPAPTLTGCTFGGWYKEAACSNVWDFANDTVTKDTTLYAKWTAVTPAAYTVTAGSVSHGSLSVSPTSAAAGDTITVTATPDTGYHLSSLAAVKTAGQESVTIENNQFTMPEADVTVTAAFAGNITNVSFYNASTLIASKLSTYNEPTNTTPAAPARDGYTFAGWHVGSESGTPFDGAGYNESGVWKYAGVHEGTLNVYAGWTQNTPEPTTYNVTFDVQGHGTAPAKQTVNHGEKVTKPADLTAAGYTFGGWYNETACTNAWDFANYTVTKDTTLYANWTVNTSSETASDGTVEFNADKGDVAVKKDSSSSKVTSLHLDSVSGVTGNVTFTADNTSAGKPPAETGKDSIVISVFSINATVTPGTKASFNVTVELVNPNDKNNVVFWHYKNEVWEKLTSSIVAENGKIITYKVETDSFSPFATTIQTEKQQPTPAPQPSHSSSSSGYEETQSVWLQPAAEPAATMTPAPTQAAEVVPGVPVASPINQPPQQTSTPAPAAGIIAGLGAAAALFGLRRK